MYLNSRLSDCEALLKTRVNEEYVKKQSKFIEEAVIEKLRSQKDDSISKI
jgi:hypothetical protein